MLALPNLMPLLMVELPQKLVILLKPHHCQCRHQPTRFQQSPPRALPTGSPEPRDPNKDVRAGTLKVISVSLQCTSIALPLCIVTPPRQRPKICWSPQTASPRCLGMAMKFGSFRMAHLPPLAGNQLAGLKYPPSRPNTGRVLVQGGKSAETRGPRVWTGPCSRTARTTEHVLQT